MSQSYRELQEEQGALLGQINKLLEAKADHSQHGYFARMGPEIATNDSAAVGPATFTNIPRL